MPVQEDKELTGEQWKKYEDKFGKLMYFISQKISGCRATASIEDNYSDLCIAAINSIRGFIDKTGLSIDELLEDSNFVKYTKTCLWNSKNKKGADLAKKYNINRDTVPISEYEGVLTTSATGGNYSEIDPPRSKGSQSKVIVDFILSNPNVVHSTGRINKSTIAKTLNIPYVLVTETLNNLKDSYNG